MGDVAQAADTERLLAAITKALSPLPEVRAALLFGSHAMGRARANSDIDVAVLLDDETVRAPSHVVARPLLQALASELAADRLDLVLLNDAPPALAFQVVKHGKLAFERDPRDLLAFRVRTYSRHSDREPVERLFREAIRKRALAGVDHGEP